MSYLPGCVQWICLLKPNYNRNWHMYKIYGIK
jgi:hypothetical protein